MDQLKSWRQKAVGSHRTGVAIRAMDRISPGLGSRWASRVLRPDVLEQLEWQRRAVAAVGVQVGKYTYGFMPLCDRPGNVARIGAFCSIAPGVEISGFNHPLDYVSTNPFLYLKSRGFVREDRADVVRPERNQPVIIGNDVWVGQRALLMPGIVLGDGCVVAAGAVVTRDVEPYEIVGGVPAKRIRKRFDDDTIAGLLISRWWEWDDESIRQAVEDGSLYRPQTFLARIEPDRSGSGQS